MDDLFKQEMDLIRVCVKMKQHGIRVDLTRMIEIKDRIMDMICVNEGLITKSVVVPFKAGRIWMEQYFKQNKIPIKRNPSTGLPIFDYDTLAKIDDPILKLILRQRDLEKSLTTIDGYINNTCDSKIYPMINTHGAATGRLSYSTPNLHSIPKEDEFGVRNCIIPEHDSYLVAMDFNSQEIALFADYSGDKKLIERINSGEDIHQYVADNIGTSRKTAKTTIFALLYGSGNQTLANTLGTSVYEAGQIRERLFLAFPSFKTFSEKVRQVAEGRGYIKNYTGKRLYTEAHGGYKALNHLIQSSGGSIMKDCMVKVDKLLSHSISRLYITVHDELVCNISYEDKGIETSIKEIMESSYPARNGVQLKVTIKQSRNNWGEVA